MTPHELEALDGALRREAEESAARIVAGARLDAEEREARARGEADALIARAAREGEAVAAEQIAREAAIVRRDATTTVLVAQQDMLDELRRRVRVAVRALRESPDYPELRNGLEERARRRLGSGARCSESSPSGGVLAELDGRRVDQSLDALADEAYEAVAAMLQERWR